MDLQQAGSASKEIPVVALDGYTDLMAFLEEMRVTATEYKVLVLESLNGFERFIHEHCTAKDYNNEWGKRGFQNYQEGYKTATQYIREFIRAMDRLREERNISVLISCHSQRTTIKNPLGADYDKVMPALHERTWELFNRWASTVLYLKKEVQVASTNGKGTPMAESRIIVTEGSAGVEAKNRWRLPSRIEMGTSGKEAFDNLVAAKKTSTK